MEIEQEQRLDEVFFRDPDWIAQSGHYVHENNVLFYFAQSPFFDKQSNNNSVFLQAISDARFSSWLATRENFEAQLRRIAGTEYVVVHDPIASKTFYKNGEPSKVWVIQKQTRRKRPGQEDEITPLAMYYIVGDAIYQAPNIAKLIGNRMLSTVTSLNKLLSIAAPLPLFSAARGHTYLTPSQTPRQTKPTTFSQQSKENTPLPDNHSTTSIHPTKPTALNNNSTSQEYTQHFLEALSLSRLHGKDYMDDLPLTGEPGNFRTSKPAPAVSKDTTTTTPLPHALKDKSPASTPAATATATAPIPLPPIQTDVPPQPGAKKSATREKGGEKSPTTPGSGVGVGVGGREKPKRRKSRPVASPTES